MRKDYNGLVIAFILILTALYVIGSTFLYKPKEIPTESKIEVRTDTIYLKDTVVIETPIEVERIKVKDKYIQDTVYIENSPTIADIPIEQAIYQDTNYLAVVSGFQPKLDSLVIYNNNKVITNEITKYKQKKWNYGIVGGVGYGLTSNKIDCWVGVGVSYTFGK